MPRKKGTAGAPTKRAIDRYEHKGKKRVNTLKDGYEVYFVSDCSAGGWISVSHGRLRVPEPVDAGELAIFESSNAAVDCTAEAEAEFVMGSAIPHVHDLALGNYSVHTSPAALREGERWLDEIQRRLRNEGRL